MNKAEIRQDAQTKWGDPQQPLEQDPRALNVRLLTYLNSRQFIEVMFYWPMWDEVDISEVVLACLSRHNQAILMRFGSNCSMLPHYITSPDDLTKNRFGIWVPKKDCAPVDVEALDAVVIPGRAFDPHCNRVGRGYGYYDRFLAQPAFTGEALGVGYDFQLYDQIPTESHDSPVDLIFTESQTIERPYYG